MTNKKKSLPALKAFMAERVTIGSTIMDWNNTREEAKELFTQEAINQLDSSGYITQLLRKAPQPERHTDDS